TPLLLASRTGNAAVLDTLVAAGADPNSATVNGTTALMFAAASGKADAVKLLLEKGAKVDAKENTRGETALMFAAAAGRADGARVLTAGRADTAITTTLVDLAVFAKEEQERFAQFLQQQGQGQGSRGSAGSQGSAAAQQGGRGGRGRQGG